MPTPTVTSGIPPKLPFLRARPVLLLIQLIMLLLVWPASGTASTSTESRVALNAEEAAWLSDHNMSVTLCVDPEWMPLEGLDAEGRHRGMAADFFELFTLRSGIRFHPLLTQSWQASLTAARERRCDLFSLAMATPERNEYMAFTEPYLRIPSVVLGRIDTPFIEDLNDLAGQSVGVVEGYAFAEILREHHPRLRLVTVASETAGLKMLESGEIYGYLSTLDTASYHMVQQGMADLKVLGRVPADWNLAVGIRRDEPVLFSIMNKLVSSLSPDESQAIESRWRTLHLEPDIEYRTLWQPAVVVLIILALVVYWNRKLGRVNRELALANERLAYLSVTDDLTRIGNRTYFDQELNKSFHWCQRHESGFAVAMIDADHFKEVNDTYGHEGGDQCLRALARTMTTHFRRETDRLARFGGEEFVIFTTYRDRNVLYRQLDAFREEVASLDVRDEDHHIHFTISIGLATGIPGPNNNPADFLRLADKALYEAKSQGRNRVVSRSL